MNPEQKKALLRWLFSQKWWPETGLLKPDEINSLKDNANFFRALGEETEKDLIVAHYQIQRAIAQIRSIPWNSPYQMRDVAQSVASQLEAYLKSITKYENL